MRIITIPNVVTLTRVFLTPVILVVLLLEYFLVGAIMFSVVLLTDLLDGWIARYYRQSSSFGAFLDPVADKLLVVSCLFYLVYTRHDMYLFVLAYISLLREILIMAARQWFAKHERRKTLRSNLLTKTKTASQGLAFIFFFYSLTDVFDSYWYDVGLVLLGFSVVLGVYSLCSYATIVYKSFSGRVD